MIRPTSGAAFLLAATLLPAFAAHTGAPAPQSLQAPAAAQKKQIIVNALKFDKIVFDETKKAENDRGTPYARFIINDSDMAIYAQGRPLVSVADGRTFTASLTLLSLGKKPDGFDPLQVDLVPASLAVADQATAEFDKARVAMGAALRPPERHWIELAQ